MHQDKFEALIDLASSKYESERAIIDEARADLAEMRQPITAEALLADGWKQDTYGAFGYPSDSTTAIWQIEIRCDKNGKVTSVRDIDGVSLPNVTTMHDMRELVRLLGGKADSAS